jgi:hypothetical protein
LNIVPLNDDFLDFPAFDGQQEFTKNNLRIAAGLFTKHAKDAEKNQQQDQPESDMF